MIDADLCARPARGIGDAAPNRDPYGSAGLMRTVDIFRGDGATSGTKWMSATIAVSKPSSRFPYNVCEVLASRRPLRREMAILSSGTVDPLDLGRAGFGIVGVGIGHRLYGDRMPPIHDPPMRAAARRLYSERFIIVHACNAADHTRPVAARIAPNTAGTRPAPWKISSTKITQFANCE